VTPTPWGLGVAVEMMGPLGKAIKSGSMLGGAFEVRVGKKSVHRERHCWWQDGSSGYLLCDNLLGHRCRSDSEAEKGHGDQILVDLIVKHVL
jgi:hypothetical protein